jgi:dimethylhistidine N-methyltransferase
MIKDFSIEWDQITLSEDVKNKEFAEDVFTGLSRMPRYISSKYFYDEKGDRLFQQIMEMEEYYLTKSELEILQNNKDYLLDYFSYNNEDFDLIELGAGDGYKTKVLLEHFINRGKAFTYMPIDISGNALKLLNNRLTDLRPQLRMKSLQGDYFEMLENLHELSNKRKVVLLLGANIGNLNEKEAISFLRAVRKNLDPGDFLLIGLDLKKDPQVILNAYNDGKGITREFNLNLLDRINRELGADFNRDNFIHYPLYNPGSGEAQSYLLSTRKQDVYISAFDLTFHLEKWESIHTEISKKYNTMEIKKLAHWAGFEIVHDFYCHRQFFVDSLWKV